MDVAPVPGDLYPSGQQKEIKACSLRVRCEGADYVRYGCEGCRVHVALVTK